MRPPRHLWRGDWRADSERAAATAAQQVAAPQGAAPDAAAEPEPAATPPPQPSRRAQSPPPPRAPQPSPAAPERRPRRRTAPWKPLAVGGLLAGLLGAAFAGGVLVERDEGPEALPAVSNQPVKPGKGGTRAAAIYAVASPAVVSVRTTGGQGTGFLIDRDGKIVTNAHVVGDTTRVTVRFGEDQSLPADVLGTDPSSDLAVLSVDPKDLPRGVKPLRFADSRTVRVGDAAIAIGNPFGLDRTATEGIVSGIGRHIDAPNGFSIDEVIQTDAPINPGNSGGPLLDASGAVIGVNAQIATGGSAGNVGIGFAVPSNTARQVVPRLARGERITRAHLGIESAPASPGADVGAEVKRVLPGGPGSQAGLLEGDVILRLDGKDVNEPADVSEAVAARRPGDEVEIEVERDGRLTKLTATLGTRPANTP